MSVKVAISGDRPIGGNRHALAFAREHLHEALPVERLARAACLSPRQFGRSFHTETGETPAGGAERLRAEAARRRIETSAEPIEMIARTVGFADPERMRRPSSAPSVTRPRGSGAPRVTPGYAPRSTFMAVSTASGVIRAIPSARFGCPSGGRTGTIWLA